MRENGRKCPSNVTPLRQTVYTCNICKTLSITVYSHVVIYTELYVNTIWNTQFHPHSKWKWIEPRLTERSLFLDLATIPQCYRFMQSNPPIIWTGKTHCWPVEISLDRWGIKNVFKRHKHCQVCLTNGCHTFMYL